MAGVEVRLDYGVRRCAGHDSLGARADPLAGVHVESADLGSVTVTVVQRYVAGVGRYDGVVDDVADCVEARLRRDHCDRWPRILVRIHRLAVRLRLSRPVCGVGCVGHRAKVQIRLRNAVAGRAGDLPQRRQSRRSVRAGHCCFVIHNCDVVQRYIAAVGHQVAVADDVAHLIVGRRCGGLDYRQGRASGWQSPSRCPVRKSVPSVA